MNKLFTNFTAGELSPLMDARVDFDKYNNGCKVLENMVVFPHGPATKRPGTRHVKFAKFPGYPSRLIPFVYDNDFSYMIEMGHEYFRFYVDNGQVVVDGSELVSNGGFAASTAGWTAWASATLNNVAGGVAGNCMQIVENGADTPTAYQIIGGLEPFAEYEWSLYIKAGAGDAKTVTPYILSASSATRGAELVANNDFEAGVANWNAVATGTFSQFTGGFYSGAACMKVNAVAGVGDGVRSDVFATANGLGYQVSFFIYCAADQQTVHVRMRNGNNTAYLIDETIEGLVYGEWNYIERTVLEGAATGGAGAYIEFIGGADASANDAFYIDDVYCYRIDSWFAGEMLENMGAKTPTGAWVQYTGSFTTPYDIGSTGAILVLNFNALNGTGDDVLIDSVSLNRTDEPYEVAHTYQYNEVDDVQWTKSADVMVMTHRSYAIRELSRTAATPTFVFQTFSGGGGLSGVDVLFTPLNAGANSYPKCCLFHENRLAFACTNNAPLDIWLSEDGDFDDFVPVDAVTDSINMSLASDEVYEIQWMKSAISIMMGTSGGEWRVGSSDENEAITPNNISAKREQTVGSVDRMPTQIGSSVFFVQEHRRKLFRLAFNWQKAGYIAPDMSVLAEHIPFKKIKYAAFQKQPHAVLWMIMDDGTLAGMTWHEEHDVVAWHTHPSDNVTFQAIAVKPGTNEDQLWVCETHTTTDVFGTYTRRFIGYLEEFFTGSTADDAYFADSCITATVSVPTTTFAAPTFFPLAGLTCKALIDGTTVETIVVSTAGGFTTTATVNSQITIGLPYTAKLKPMRPEIQTQQGSLQGEEKSIKDVVLRLYKSMGGSIGQDEGKVKAIPYKAPELAADDAGTSLFTGDLEPFTIEGGVSQDGYIYIEHSDPTPLTVQGIFVDIG